jgi:subtilase family serine protease
VALALPLSDAAGAANFIAHVSKVGDPLYRAFLTPHEFARRFGADAKAYDALSSCAVKQGLAVGEGSISRTVLTVTGRTAQIEAAFGVKLSDYRKADGKTFCAADRAPTLSGSNAPDVAVSVLGMSSYTHFVPLARIQPAGKPIKSMGSGPGGACNAADLRTVFGASAASGWVQGNRRLV